MENSVNVTGDFLSEMEDTLHGLMERTNALPEELQGEMSGEIDAFRNRMYECLCPEEDVPFARFRSAVTAIDTGGDMSPNTSQAIAVLPSAFRLVRSTQLFSLRGISPEEAERALALKVRHATMELEQDLKKAQTQTQQVERILAVIRLAGAQCENHQLGRLFDRLQSDFTELAEGLRAA